MLLPRFVGLMFSVGMMVLGASAVCSQDYPNKPIRIVTGGVAGANDAMARLIALGISGPLSQPVTVENLGSGFISGEIVSKAPPDGYTLIVVAGTFWIGPLFEKVPYDPVRDFTPITAVARSPNLIVVHPSLPTNSVRELIALAKARPGELSYASSAAGSTNHLSAELFKAMAGVNIVRIPYKSGATQMTDLVGGQVHLMFGNVATVAPHVKSSKLKALAVTSAQPSVLAPGLPTVAASGLPGYETGAMSGILAPAKTPATIINRLNREMVRFLSQPDVKQKFFDFGVETVGNSQEQFGSSVKAEIAKWAKVIKDAGIKAD